VTPQLDCIQHGLREGKASVWPGFIF